MKNLYRTFYLIVFLIFSYSSYSQSGELDPSFFTTGTFGGTNGSTIYATALQNEKLIVGGDFTHFRDKEVNHIVRLNADGTRDLSFNSGSGFDADLGDIIVLTDGKILAGGDFEYYNGHYSPGIIKLNADGSVASGFNVGAGALELFSAGVWDLLVQPDGKIVACGYFTSFNGLPFNRIIRLNSDGSIDNSFNIGTGANAQIRNMALQADGKIVLGGQFTSFNGQSHNRLVRLNSDGTIDPSFSIGTGPDGNVAKLAIESDGSILAGGFFNNFNGVARQGFVRLNPDGSLNSGFIVNANPVEAIAIQPDNKIIIGGQFNTVNGIKKYSIARLNTDGTIDPSFSIHIADDTNVVYSSSELVFTLTIDNDGNVFAGGAFRMVNKVYQHGLVKLSSNGTPYTYATSSGIYSPPATACMQPDNKLIYTEKTFYEGGTVATARIFRILPDGQKDPSFITGIFNNDPSVVTLQKNGKILVAGNFTRFNGQIVNRVIRLNPDGSLDPTFNIGTGPNNFVGFVLVQEDQKILLGGDLTTFNGVTVNRIVRLNQDGSIDGGFASGSGFDGGIRSMILDEVSQRIYVCGTFNSYNGAASKGMVAIKPDGSRDNTFNVGTGLNGAICLAVRPDGKLLVGGGMNSYNGTSVSILILLNTNGTLDNSFSPEFINENGVISHTGCSVVKLGVQSDGKIVYALHFTTYPYMAKVGRLNPNGSADQNFNRLYSIGSYVYSLSLYDNYILIGGHFFYARGVSVSSLFRLYAYPSKYNLIRGRVVKENNHDCTIDPDEEGIPGIFIKADPGPFFSVTDTSGYYKIYVDSGSTQWSVSQILPDNDLISQDCPVSAHSVSLTGFNKDTCCFNFSNEVQQCAYLNVSINSNRRRRCMRSYTTIEYCNSGNVTASNLELKVDLPEYVRAVSSQPFWENKTDSTLTYTISSLNPGECQRIIIVDSVICGTPWIRGLTQCTRASLSPKNNCEPNNSLWDESSVAVKGICMGETVKFEILNQGSGNMSDSSSYRVFINDTLAALRKFKLLSSEKISVMVTNPGSTVRLEADQSLYHPGKSRPMQVIEACGGDLESAVRNLVTTRYQDDLDPEVAISCMPILDSFDPNDKNALPAGLTDNNFISGMEELKYTIRFQNTGSDTAYNIYIVDSLDSNLDYSTFRPSSSSHNYTLDVSGEVNPVLIFRFNQIMLPDSTTDLQNSMGYVEYYISPVSGLMNGTLISNTAGIYFDFNDPVITNTYTHQISENDLVDYSKGVYVIHDQVTNTFDSNKSRNILVYPNPSSADLKIEIENPGNTSELRLFSILGNEVLYKMLFNYSSIINLDLLEPGTYLYEIRTEGNIVHKGKIIKK